MRSIIIPTQLTECRDPHCKKEEHIAACDWFAAELLEGIQDSAEETLPKPKEGGSNKGSKVTPGFREQVQPSKDTAHIWHAVWKSAGRPVNTQLHKIMKSTKNQYHKNFKQCQRSEAKTKRSKLLDACLNGNGDLFQEIKSLRRSKTVCADSNDGVKEDIPGHFKEIYRNLYNCVHDAEEVMEIREEVENNIKEASLDDVDRVTSEKIRKAALLLKPGKGDPAFSLVAF